MKEEDFSCSAMAPADLSTILPRVLIVSRRTVRKNKFVDFVGMSSIRSCELIGFMICSEIYVLHSI